jgi:hypothetical protein
LNELFGNGADNGLGPNNPGPELTLGVFAHQVPGQSQVKDRENARRAAAEAVYAYLIQRELCGLRDQQAFFRNYGVPGEVIAILGAR